MCINYTNLTLLVYAAPSAGVDFSSVNNFKNVSVLMFPSFLDGVCDLCVFFFFRAAVRAFSLACPADYCLIVTHCICCHSWQINLNVNVNVQSIRDSPSKIASLQQYNSNTTQFLCNQYCFLDLFQFHLLH